jgi:alkanesulfonate monooxygenase SsuD/methylene tetrahydromethanopterin reductase-like flavin-dependent oxidoreductase (luciferase family)
MAPAGEAGRDGAGGAPSRTPGVERGRLPIGVALHAIGVDFAWWRASALRLEAAGYRGVWCWDHFVSRGRLADPVLECWTTLTAVAASSERLTVAPFVLNVMNRHPAVVARMAATLQQASDGRLILGIGIGGHPAEHEAYGIPFPPVEERAARLEEAVAVIRALWTGGPVSFEGRYYRLSDAYAFPRPDPAPPIIVGGETPAGARLAARIGDGWTAFEQTFARDEPAYREALEAAGRDRSAMTVLVGFQAAKGGSLAGSPWAADLRGTFEGWQRRGADGAVLTAITDADVDALVAAAARW